MLTLDSSNQSTLLDPSIFALKSAAIDSLLQTLTSPESDPREKRHAVTVALRYVNSIESRLRTAPAPDRAAPRPRAIAQPFAPSSPSASPEPTALPRPRYDDWATAPAAPVIQHPPPPSIAQNGAPSAPASQIPIDTPSPAALLRTRAGASPPSNAPHAGVNFHPTIISTPRAPPQPTWPVQLAA